MRGVNADSRRVTAGSPTAAPGRPATAPGKPGNGPGPVPRLAVPLAVLAAVAAAFAYVGMVDPNEPGHYPVCPLLRYAGIYCPGCGGLRSAHAFVHGDFAAALHDNALAVAGYLAFAVVWTVWAFRAARGRPLRLEPGPAHLWALGGLLLAFTVVRNLPFGGLLHP
ncbi:DUF2752 domain-containing protein [Streptomyces anandii]|uniref:DUF2752 domain-containing protein n=1 Tax=Streptomyces anandii TaxID=285454 RepID=UPI001673F162|nr:DUF2752 domain-containing protein [Streptomyces anandii]